MNELKALFQTISEDSAKEIHNYIKDFDIKNIDSDRKFKVIASTEDTDRS
jgi:acetolactate synthase small subunit